jgi:hypothetical protein
MAAQPINGRADDRDTSLGACLLLITCVARRNSRLTESRPGRPTAMGRPHHAWSHMDWSIDVE